MTDWLDHVHRFQTLESTMTTAREFAARGATHGTTIVAKEQTLGRGRRGRMWFSPAGGLWMTTLLRPQREGIHELGLVAGVAVWSALQDLSVKTKLKWPNDIVVDRRKLCGILLEGETTPDEQVAFIGVGLNIAKATDHTPADIRESYLGLGDLAPHLSIDDVFAKILTHLQSGTNAWERNGLLHVVHAWEQADALMGKHIRAQGPSGPIEGIAQGLGTGGALCLETPDGPLEVHAGEVQHVRPTDIE